MFPSYVAHPVKIVAIKDNMFGKINAIQERYFEKFRNGNGNLSLG